MANIHKGQILPLVNQMVPISKDTVFHADYNYDLHGFNQGKAVMPIGASEALYFDGVSGTSISTPDLDFASTDSWTAECWVYRETSDGSWVFLLGDTTAHTRAITINPTDNFLSFRADSSSYHYSSGVVTRETWHHICVTYSNGDISFYLNGIPCGTSIGKSSMTFNNIGWTYTSSNVPHFKGRVAQVKIWNSALLRSEVISSMNGGLSENKESLVAYYKLNEKEGPTAFDHSGQGNDGVWGGGLSSIYGPTVATLTEGKFRKGVSIEPETANLVPVGMRTCSADFNMQGGGTYTNEIEVDGRPDVKRIHVAGSTGDNAYAYFGIWNVLTATAGDVVTVSFDYKIVKGTGRPKLSTIYADGYKNPDSSNIGSIESDIITDLGGGWYRCANTVTINADGNTWFRWNYHSNEMEAESLVDNFQIEKKSYATSFVDGTRPDGRLDYPVKINTNEFTISFWMKKHANNSTASQLINLLHNGELVLWWDIKDHYNRMSMSYAGGSYSRIDYNFSDGFLKDWNIYTLVYRNNQNHLYVNGELKATGDSHSIPSERIDEIIIARHPDGAQTTNNIILDEVRIEDRAISEEEVQAWAASGLHYNYLDYRKHVD